tara:strand:- start:30861 stop:31169 length:309 start_codon:yes stop_codon:yes gene_type:complete
MKAFIILVFLLSGCVSLNRHAGDRPARNADFPSKPEVNSSAFQNHPEYPLVASPVHSAWEIGVWLALIIFLICISPGVGRFICERWQPFWCPPKKDLTEKED